MGPHPACLPPYYPVATLGKISNKLNRQPSDLAYDCWFCCHDHGMVGVIYTGLLLSLHPHPPRPIKLLFTIDEFSSLGYLKIETQRHAAVAPALLPDLFLMCRRSV